MKISRTLPVVIHALPAACASLSRCLAFGGWFRFGRPGGGRKEAGKGRKDAGENSEESRMEAGRMAPGPGQPPAAFQPHPSGPRLDSGCFPTPPGRYPTASAGFQPLARSRSASRRLAKRLRPTSGFRRQRFARQILIKRIRFRSNRKCRGKNVERELCET